MLHGKVTWFGGRDRKGSYNARTGIVWPWCIILGICSCVNCAYSLNLWFSSRNDSEGSIAMTDANGSDLMMSLHCVKETGGYLDPSEFFFWAKVVQTDGSSSFLYLLDILLFHWIWYGLSMITMNEPSYSIMNVKSPVKMVNLQMLYLLFLLQDDPPMAVRWNYMHA